MNLFNWWQNIGKAFLESNEVREVYLNNQLDSYKGVETLITNSLKLNIAFTKFKIEINKAFFNLK